MDLDGSGCRGGHRGRRRGQGSRTPGADAGQAGGRGRGPGAGSVTSLRPFSGHQLAPGYWPPAGHRDRSRAGLAGTGVPAPGADQWLQAGPGPLRAPRDQDRGGGDARRPWCPAPESPGPGDLAGRSYPLGDAPSPEPGARELPGGAGTGATGTRHGYRQASTGATREPGREPGTGARTKRLAPLAPLARCRYPLWTWRPSLVVRQENHDLAVSPVDLASAGTLGTSGQLTLRSDPPSWSAWRAGPRDGPRGGPRATSWFGSRGQAGPPGRSSGRSPD